MAPEQSDKVDNMIDRAFGSCVVREKIAVGGFGTVYKAIDERLDIPRAVKIFHPHLSEEKGFRKRFEIEMRLLAHLDHPNIVRIITAIDEPDASGFIMEFVEGDTLSIILENEGQLPINKTIDIFTQVSRAIAYAHNLKHQIIHRDLSPDNIMIRPDGVVKIMDFGIAKTIGSERVTQTGIVLGKPTYMAPEQFEGTVSIYTDQYALGVILYEMVAGKVPFDAESPIALYKLHLNEPPVSPREHNEAIPINVEKVILKSLSKDEKERFKHIDEMIDALVMGDKKQSAVDNKVPSLMLQVDDAVKQEDFDRALDLLQEVLSYDPKNKETLNKREEVLKLQKAHRDQDLLEEWFHQAQAFHESNMEDESCSSLVDFMKLAFQYPGSSTIKWYKSSLLKQMPDVFNRAKKIMEEDKKKMEQLTISGKSLFQQNKFNDALHYFEEAGLLFPNNETLEKLKALTQKRIKMAQVASCYRDGVMALKNQDYATAMSAFEKVLKLHPQHKDAKKYREMAETELEKLERSRSEVDATYREAMELYEKWEYTLAMEKFKQVLELDDRHEEAKRLLNESQHRVDDETKIEEIGFFYNQGLTFYKSQQWEKSITCFKRVLKCMDSHKGAMEYLQLAEAKLSQQGQVEASFQEALEFFRNSQYAEALQRLNQIIAIDKNHKGAKQYLALCGELQGLADDTSGLTFPDSQDNMSAHFFNVNPSPSEEPSPANVSQIPANIQVPPPRPDKEKRADETDEDLVAQIHTATEKKTASSHADDLDPELMEEDEPQAPPVSDKPPEKSEESDENPTK